MSNPVDDIINTFGVMKKLAMGETTVDEIGEAATGGQALTVEICPKGGCALAANHEGRCVPVKAT